MARTGRDSDVWPVVLLLLAVLVPAVCLIWFMNAAMQNERLAARQKLADAYRVQLSATQAALDRHWEKMLEELEEYSRGVPAAVAFARCVESGLVDSVILFDERGSVAYPNKPLTPALSPSDGEREANHAEYSRKDYLRAAELYRALAKEATNVDVAARALQAEGRCLVRAGRKEDAIRLVKETFGQERYRQAIDAQGRLIVANAELMALELGGDESIRQRLQKRLIDYENPGLATPQRRFLMKELQRLSSSIQFPTLAAEELAAGVPRTNVWEFANGRVLALLRPDKVHSHMRKVASAGTELLPPGSENSAFVSLPAGSRLPGWHLVVPLDTSTQSRRRIYMWAAVLVLSVMGVLTLLAVRVLRRQSGLARLKNDLVATVSHELKTPLSSMRVLVDTLLDSEKFNEQTTREYLGLIARENDRLNRLIQNFLTFSRMERNNKHTFQIGSLPVRPIIDAAVAAVPNGRVEVQVEPNLPRIMGDTDAVATALINLLDNACKYSEDPKPIIVRAHAQNGSVLLSVQDHGIGISLGDRKKIFRPFYQVDQRLSRNGGGCGLGLSIVQSIVTAHRGSVAVESHPGRGSVFTISLPAA